MQSLVMALTGNPNAGKTTLFNAITGARQHVGNYPGITVEKKEGAAETDGVRLRVVDLPGTYSLTAYSQEELVARRFLVEERPQVVVDVINAGALERNLYLAVQLLEMGAPLVLALNMMDEVRKQGASIDAKLLSKLLDLPVVETVARTGQGKEELLREAVAFAARRSDRTPLAISYGPDLDPVLKDMTALIEKEGLLTDRYPARWTALKLLEGDEDVRRLGQSAPAASQRLETMARKVGDHTRKTLGMEPEAIIADYRYGFIASLLKKGVLVRDDLRERIDFSDRMDRLLTHPLLGPAVMLAILYAIYSVTFTVGDYPMTWTQDFFAWLGDAASAVMPDGLLKSLVVSGVIGGVGGVLGFVPLIMIMFLCIAFLEDSGYMARMAYMLDRVFRIFGLHGCSVMPFIVSGGIAGGCAVPGIMAARTLRSPKEKLATILTAPFMTCGAKLPVFLLLTGAFFPESGATVMFSITMLGWAMALLAARIFRSTIIRGPATPFVMELPPYRMPTLQGVLIHAWERTWQYIRKAGTVLLAISILVWAAMTFPQLDEEAAAPFEARIAALTARLEALPEAADAASQPEQAAQAEEPAQARTALEAEIKDVENEQAQLALRNSVAGRIGLALEPVSALAGFDWRTNIALVGGFAAKEVIVATLGTAFSMGEVDAEDSGSLSERLAADPTWSPITAVALIVFVLLYAPCVAAVATMAKEASWGWAVFAMAFNTVLAYGAAVTIYQFGATLLG